MQMSEAVNEILQDTLYWIEQNKDRGAWVMINFPSKFLHVAKLLVHTPQFNNYSKISFLKARNLRFDFRKGDLSYVAINYTPGEYNSSVIAELNLELMTTLQRLQVTGLSERYQNREKPTHIQPTSSFATKVDDTSLVNLAKIKSFKFTN